jgi:translocation and assembly module TamB
MLRSKWFRRTLIVLALVAAIAAGFYLFLQSEPGRNVATALIESAVSSDNLSIKIDGLAGVIPAAPRVAKMTLSDRAGPWLVLHDVRLRWSPLALIGGDFVAEAISVRRLEWLRSIAPQVAGVGATFALEGAADTLNMSERALLELSLKELGAPGAALTLDAHYDPEQSRLDLDGKVEDRAGGTLATMLDLPSDGRLARTPDRDGWRRAQRNGRSDDC